MLRVVQQTTWPGCYCAWHMPIVKIFRPSLLPDCFCSLFVVSRPANPFWNVSPHVKGSTFLPDTSTTLIEPFNQGWGLITVWNFNKATLNTREVARSWKTNSSCYEVERFSLPMSGGFLKTCKSSAGYVRRANYPRLTSPIFAEQLHSLVLTLCGIINVDRRRDKIIWHDYWETAGRVLRKTIFS